MLVAWGQLLGFQNWGTRDYSRDLQREVCHDSQYTPIVPHISHFPTFVKENFGTKLANLEVKVMNLGVTWLGVGQWLYHFLTG